MAPSFRRLTCISDKQTFRQAKKIGRLKAGIEAASTRAVKSVALATGKEGYFEMKIKLHGQEN